MEIDVKLERWLRALRLCFVPFYREKGETKYALSQCCYLHVKAKEEKCIAKRQLNETQSSFLFRI